MGSSLKITESFRGGHKAASIVIKGDCLLGEIFV
jgi:hypothetical protein